MQKIVYTKAKPITIYSDGTICGRKVYTDKAGYKSVFINSKRKLVHRLVAEAFIEGFYEGCQVHHVNEDKSDNRVENLVVMSAQEHQALHKTVYPKTKVCVVCGEEFTPHPTKRKRARVCSQKCWNKFVKTHNAQYRKPIKQYSKDGKYIKTWSSGKEIEETLGYADSNISKCCYGKIHSCYGSVWKFDGKENEYKKDFDYERSVQRM